MQALRDEEITTGHRPPSSKYTYFNSVGRGLRSSFWDSSFASFPLSSLVDKWRISSSFSKDKEQHINLRVHSIFQEALPIPLSILSIAAAAAHTVLPQWCQSNTPFLDLLPLGEYAFCWDERCLAPVSYCQK